VEAERLVDLGPLSADASLFPASGEHSSKTAELISLVKERLKNPGSKIVIFSQWTSFLTVFSKFLMQEGILFTRLDGKMKPDERDAAVKGLQKKGSLRVMLASLRVAGVGINLCAADTVILADLCKLQPLLPPSPASGDFECVELTVT
jgi:SWI/SNF-related matrix-associated actin-dependent regulator of chromatin subfamily A3